MKTTSLLSLASILSLSLSLSIATAASSHGNLGHQRIARHNGASGRSHSRRANVPAVVRRQESDYGYGSGSESGDAASSSSSSTSDSTDAGDSSDKSKSKSDKQADVVESVKSNGETVTLIMEPTASSSAGSQYVVTSTKSNGEVVTMTMDGTAPPMQTKTPNTVAEPDLCKTGSQSTDLLVLNFANVLEQLETQFYIQGLAKFSQSDMQKAGLTAAQAQIVVETLTVIAGDENAHAIALQETIRALGSEPVNKCGFDFTAALTSPAVFLATARALELVGVSAYAGGAGLITSRSLLTAAVTIHSIEARHQTTLNILNAGSVIPAAFDMALNPQSVLALAGGFLTGCTPEDLGLTANQPLSIRNAGTGSTVFAPGDQLTFTSTIQADPASVFCAMLLGGATQSITLPLSACKIPEGVDGPVYVYLTSDDTPLAADIQVQDTTTILAGPGLIFVEGSSSVLQDVFSFQNNKNGNNGVYRNKGRGNANADLGYSNVCNMGGLNKSGTWFQNNPMAVPQKVGIGCKVLGFSIVGKDALPH